MVQHGYRWIAAAAFLVACGGTGGYDDRHDAGGRPPAADDPGSTPPLFQPEPAHDAGPAPQPAPQPAPARDAGQTPSPAPASLVAPTGLTARAVSDRAISLSWTTHNFGQSGARVERRSASESRFREVATAGRLLTSYQDTGLQPNTEYVYRVADFDARGVSPFSAEARARTLADANMAPSAPTGVTATPQNYPLLVTVEWRDVTGATEYRVYRKKASDPSYPATPSGRTWAANWVDSTVERGTSYKYVVRAANRAGESRNSSEVSATAPR